MFKQTGFLQTLVPFQHHSCVTLANLPALESIAVAAVAVVAAADDYDADNGVAADPFPIPVALQLRCHMTKAISVLMYQLYMLKLQRLQQLFMVRREV